MRKIVFLLGIILSINTLFAQSTCTVTHYSTSEGLPQEIVYDIIQDYKGYMWFCTKNGLSKFDGYTFKNYKAHPGDGTTLNTNRIDLIKEGAKDHIWCRTYDRRIYLFNSKNEKFSDILEDIEQELKQTFTIQYVYPLKNGITWLTDNKNFCFRINEDSKTDKPQIEIYSTYNEELKGGTIYNILMDSEGDEWILTEKGVTLVGKKQIESNFPFNSLIEKNKFIWLGSPQGCLGQYDKQTQTLIFIDIPYNIQTIHTLSDINSRQIAIGTDDGLLLYDIHKNTFEQIDIRTEKQSSNVIEGIYKDNLGELWLINNNPGVTRVNIETKQCQYLYTPPREVVSGDSRSRFLFYEDKYGQIWLVPREGNFCYYDRKSKKLNYTYINPEDSASRVTPIVRNYYADRQGNLWINDLQGVKKLSFFKKNYVTMEGSRNAQARSFLRDHFKRSWIGTKSGKISIYNQNNRLMGFLTTKGEITSQPQQALNTGAYTMLEDIEGNIWIGTKEDGIYLLEKKTNQSESFHMTHLTHNKSDNYSLSHNSVYILFQDSKKRIWAGTYGGGVNLIKKNEEGTFKFIHFNNLLKNFPANQCSKVRYITETREGIMMVGTTEGLLTFDKDFSKPEDIKFYRSSRLGKAPNSLSNNDVMHIYQASDGNIYLATASGGMNKVLSDSLLTNNLLFKAYTEQTGLLSDLTLSLIEDKERHIWVVQENGLSRFYPDKETFDNFGNHFFQSQVLFSEAIPINNGQENILFGTDNGALEISPGEMDKSNFSPSIVFTGLEIQNLPADYDIDDTNLLVLKPDERNLTIRFAALDYTDTGEIMYAYMLEGIDKDWNYAGESRSANYINLPDGKYNFLVKSTNSDRVWRDNIRSLPIKVTPTFGETIWAKIVYLILLLGVIVITVYVFLYIYKLRHQVNIEQQMANIKLRFFTDVSHELRTPLTLIASPVTEVLENETLSENAKENLKLVQKNTSRMLNLVNEILDFRKIENNKMKLFIEEIQVIPLLTTIADNFNKMAEEKQIEYNYQFPVEEVILWIDKAKFEKIFFNLISNAFKYTPSGKPISIKVMADDSKITICIIDKGIGISPDKQQSLFKRFETLTNHNILEPSSGIGLSLVKELVELHHGTIEVSSQPEQGSEFRVEFLKGNLHFREDPYVEFILTDIIEKTDTSTSEEEQPIISENQEEITILIVEDNPELRNFLKRTLSVYYNTVEAENGKEGLDKALEFIPDLIISDISMPVMDGLDMVKIIKENSDICHIPIILLSARASLDDRIKGLEYGIDDYMTKPFSSTYLKTRIKNILQIRKELQERTFLHLTTSGHISNKKLDPSKPQITPQDEKFMEQVMMFMEDNMENSQLTIEDFANSLAIGRTIFYKKLKSIVGLTPIEFVKEIRIKRAVQLMPHEEYSIAEIAYMTGFNDPKYFSKCFKKQTGATPSDYREQLLIQE